MIRSFTRKKIALEDGEEIIAYDSEGGGTPVVFIHGFPENHLSWKPLLERLGADGRLDFRWICYDLRGFGESSKRGEASLNRFFLDHQSVVAGLGIGRYHVVGHDW